MKTLVIILAIVVVVLLGILIFAKPVQGPTVTDNQTSTASPSPSPAQSVSSDGKVVVSLPKPNDLVTSPVTIVGTVTGGGWFFEAVFPIKVVNASGTVIGTGQAHPVAAANWMSTGTVQFSADIVFTAAQHNSTGKIILSKDNPSGDPKNAASFSVPVIFK